MFKGLDTTACLLTAAAPLSLSLFSLARIHDGGHSGRVEPKQLSSSISDASFLLTIIITPTNPSQSYSQSMYRIFIRVPLQFTDQVHWIVNPKRPGRPPETARNTDPFFAENSGWLGSFIDIMVRYPSFPFLSFSDFIL